MPEYEPYFKDWKNPRVRRAVKGFLEVLNGSGLGLGEIGRLVVLGQLVLPACEMVFLEWRFGVRQIPLHHSCGAL